MPAGAFLAIAVCMLGVSITGILGGFPLLAVIGALGILANLYCFWEARRKRDDRR